ncbi:LURP-one-related family protein [Haloferula sp. BvORR071]|uniref:LURP-one-related/scramblase family protein n=1 Tax=Haloferula sp. BvORR071 TaxID=1396141 RepID=UPI00054FF36F|nr:LURP-one-related family protein [Haloferula sp. BvORR071]
MRYALRQKFWSFGEDFTIRDDEGRDCYIVDGRVFSFGDKLSIHDMEGREVAYIEQRLLSWGPKYEIHRPGRDVVEVAKEHFTFFYCKFTVDGPGSEEDYEADGDFFDHEYLLKWSGQTVGRVSKEWFTFSDSYGIEIGGSEDPVLLLAITVVIDMVCHDEKKH